jgi:hypothetical protein
VVASGELTWGGGDLEDWAAATAARPERIRPGNSRAALKAQGPGMGKIPVERV